MVLGAIAARLVDLDGGVVSSLEALAGALLLGTELDRVGPGGLRPPGEGAAPAVEGLYLVHTDASLARDLQLDRRQLRKRETDSRELADGGRGGSGDRDLRRIHLVAAVLLRVRAVDLAEVADARVVHDLPQQLVVARIRDLSVVGVERPVAQVAERDLALELRFGAVVEAQRPRALAVVGEVVEP